MIKNKLIGFLCVSIIVSFSGSLVSSSQETIKWVSLNNLPCQARSKLVDINSFFYLLLVLISVVDVAILLIIHMLDYVFQIG